MRKEINMLLWLLLIWVMLVVFVIEFTVYSVGFGLRYFIKLLEEVKIEEVH